MNILGKRHKGLGIRVIEASCLCKRIIVILLVLTFATFAQTFTIDNDTVKASLSCDNENIAYGGRETLLVEYLSAGQDLILRPALECDTEDVKLFEKSRTSSTIIYEVEPEKLGSLELLMKFTFEDEKGQGYVYPFGKLILNVSSALTDEDNSKLQSQGAIPFVESLKPQYAPENLPVNTIFALSIALGVVLLAILICFIVLRVAKQKKAEIKYVVLHKSAYKLLDNLKFDNLPAKGEMKRYVYLLSSILRHYIELRFTLPATDMTTEEFLEDIYEKDIFSVEQKESLQGFLNQADLVKFAGFSPSEKQAEDMMATAKDFIRNTEDYNFMVTETKASDYERILEVENASVL